MFIISQLSHRYTTGKLLSFPDWQAEQGEKWLLMGTSGSGKTTLLHILAGLLRPAQGEVLVAGENIYALKGSKADRFRGKHIGLVLQKPHLIPTLSVEENLLLAQYLAGITQDRKRIEHILEALHLDDKRKALPHTLSGGEAGRAAIARTVLNKPSLILADEPTASLDDKNCNRVIALLEEQAASCQATLVVATHDSRIKDRFSRQYILSEETPHIPHPLLK